MDEEVLQKLLQERALVIEIKSGLAADLKGLNPDAAYHALRYARDLLQEWLDRINEVLGEEEDGGNG